MNPVSVPSDDLADQGLPVVCLVSELAPPPGGMAMQAQMLTTGLRHQGHIVLNVPTNALAYTSIWRCIPLLRGLLNFMRYLAHLWPSCRKADILHIFSNSYLNFFLFTIPAVMVGRITDKRIILHYHGGAAEAFLNRWFWLVRPAFQTADTIIVPSSFLAEIFSNFRLQSIQVANIISLENFPFRNRVPLRPRIIMARHLEPDYNVGCGLRAFAILRKIFPHATLIITGDGSERQALIALAIELSIAEAVIFTGNVDSVQMRLLYEQSDLFLNSSRVDNQPISILEAFACGLPVVTTAVGGIPYMTTHGYDALLAPDNDAPMLAQHLNTLLIDAALATALIQNGRCHVENYRWEHIYPRLAAIYRGEAMI